MENPKKRFIFAENCNSSHAMSENQLRSYRLSSLEEPTDEMLHAIMEKVAEAARESTRRANEAKKRMLEETQARIRERKAQA